MSSQVKLNARPHMKTNLLTDVKSDTIRWLRGLFAPMANPTEAGADPTPMHLPANGYTILVVDDDPVFLGGIAGTGAR